jgi:hypothetical protein
MRRAGPPAFSGDLIPSQITVLYDPSTETRIFLRSNRSEDFWTDGHAVLKRKGAKAQRGKPQPKG